jgi:hypothetical protein
LKRKGQTAVFAGATGQRTVEKEQMNIISEKTV